MRGPRHRRFFQIRRWKPLAAFDAIGRSRRRTKRYGSVRVVYFGKRQPWLWIEAVDNDWG
jgi:hypothetical protein